MKVNIAAVQYACGANEEANLDTAEALVREAARDGANIVLLPEMFSIQFVFNFDWSEQFFDYADTLENSRALQRMRSLAKELGIVIPANFFERSGQAYFNTNLVIDADGKDLGIYRKMHIPMGPPSCYEKYYFSPGDQGFRVFETAFGTLGCAICWDQWFPETARIMALKGAEILLYPTAIGSDCEDHWRAAMCGHAASNITPVVAANRIGEEAGARHTTRFWGGSFIASHRGQVLDKADDQPGFVSATLDLDENRKQRADWAMFRDRRIDQYQPLLSLDGAG